MNFLGPKQYAFDMSGEHPDNFIKKEPLEIEPDSGSVILIPSYGPFYAKGFELYTPDHQLLTLDVDYRFYNLMGELSSYTAKRVVGIIELLKPNLTKVLASYHTLGDTDFWDSNLIKMVVNAATDDRPVYWENLTGIPLGFPSDIHGESFIYQLTSFTDFVAFIKDFTKAINETPAMIERKTGPLIGLIESSITRYKRMLESLIASHEKTYNAHGLTKSQVGLGNVDNYPTASIALAKAGVSSRHHLTPPALAAIVNEFGYDESRFLEADVIPISMYGNRNFIPPAIDGSYEAIGVTENRAVSCLEEDGTIAILSPRYDGKTRGLYYSRISDFNDSLLMKYDYTAARYEHSRLKTDNVKVTTAIGGSDFNALIIGDDTPNNMYVTLTNGTFNPAKHDLKKVDCSKVILPYTSGVLTYGNLAYLGDKIAVMIHTNRVVGYNTEALGQIKMFYIDVAEIKDPVLDTVELKNWVITYDSPDGILSSNTQFLNLSPTHIDPTNPAKLTQLYYKFPKPVNASGGGYRSVNVVAAINPANKNESVINVSRAFYCTYRDDANVLQKIGINVVETIWKRVGDRLTMIDCTPTDEPDLAKLGLAVFRITPQRVRNQSNQSTSMLSNGQRATCRSANGAPGLNNSIFVEKCDKTPYEWLSKCSFTTNHDVTFAAKVERFAPPMKRGLKPTEITWTRDGYECTHLDSRTGLNGRTYVKLHDSPNKSNLPFSNWGIRNEVVFAGGPYYSLPIPAPFQETTLTELFVRPSSNITGDNTFLSTVNAGYGLNLKGNYGLNRSLGGMDIFDDALSAGDDDGVLLYDSAGDLLYYPSNIVNQLKALVNGAGVHPVRAVNIADLSANVNKNNGYSGTWNPNLAIAMITYGVYAPALPSKWCKTVTIRPTIAANVNGLYNPNYPRIVTSIAILDASVGSRLTTTEASMTEDTWKIGWGETLTSQRRMLQGYVSGNSLTFAFEPNLLSLVVGDTYTPAVVGVITISTGKLSGVGGYNLGSAWNPGARLAIPRVGMCTTDVSSVTFGGCALIVSSGGKNYCVYNTFLKDGWDIYIGEADVIFNGRVYPIDVQTIDVRDVGGVYTNQKFYIYVKLLNDTPFFYLSRNKVQETIFHMWIGTCETDNAGIKNITRQNVLSLNGVRLGTTRGGSTIIGSLGSVNAIGSIPWFSRTDII